MGFVSRADLRLRQAVRATEAARVKAELVARLGLTPDDAVSVNEVACDAACCPDVATVVLVMRAREPTRSFRIARPLAAVTPADLAGVREAEARSRG
ncbi:hypothetical protein [Methylobacterium sp. J-090]|uniref:hypothetical protein n=1 Tax=Methylobacterium sp. J-090 TaxID=2836666 RepID=UPI001FBB7C9D|nr:hypothetical protein [Methylobacterium sp. J-090]MCJ2082574.1 hypothetical protein [Methylobacterium sp. J-090]